jgi:hypothetical protein
MKQLTKHSKQWQPFFIFGTACTLAAAAGVGYASWYKSAASGNVANLLHAIIAPRFQTVNNRDFGLFRIAPKIAGHGHMGSLEAENAREIPLIAQLNTTPYEFRAGFIHTGYRLDRRTGLALPNESHPSYSPIFLYREKESLSSPMQDAIKEQARALEPTLLKTKANFETGHDVNFKTSDGWDVSVRPISAQNETCVSCHSGLKKGEVMGAMVYLTRLNRDKPHF